MANHNCISSFLRPVIFSLIFIFIANPAAQPGLKPQLAFLDNTYQISVISSGLPIFKRLALTFGFNPILVDPTAATVSSPLPETAFGAMIDTARKEIVINVVATSIVQVQNGTPISILKGPASSQAEPSKAIFLKQAFCIDNNDKQITLAIDSPIPVDFFSKKTVWHGPNPVVTGLRLYSIHGRQASQSAVVSGIHIYSHKKFILLKGF